MSTDHPARKCQLANYDDLFLRLRDAALLVGTEEFEILDCNDVCETLLGQSSSELLGQSIQRWSPEPRREELLKTLRVTRRRYHPREWATELLRRDGTPMPVRINACMLKLNNGQEAIQLMFRDITDEIEAQTKIQLYIGQLEVLNKKLEALSTTDEMTQLPNFREFQNQLRAEHSRSSRYESVYSILFFDVDHFKNYNDRNGHPAGDEVLRQIAKILRNSCRDTDFPARYGGEEFVILCPEVPWQKAQVVAQRVAKKIAEFAFPFGEFQPLGQVSVSIGIASYPQDGSTAEQVLEASDKAVYQSKKDGRNRITAFSEHKSPPPS